MSGVALACVATQRRLGLQGAYPSSKEAINSNVSSMVPVPWYECQPSTQAKQAAAVPAPKSPHTNLSLIPSIPAPCCSPSSFFLLPPLLRTTRFPPTISAFLPSITTGGGGEEKKWAQMSVSFGLVTQPRGLSIQINHTNVPPWQVGQGRHVIWQGCVPCGEV